MMGFSGKLRPGSGRAGSGRSGSGRAGSGRAGDGPARSSEREGQALVLDRLCRSFGQATALDGFSLDLAPGELMVLLGPSGCGKTTALRIVAGFETCDSGRVLLEGVDISGVPANRRDMGMVFQSYSLFPHLTAEQNVAFGLRLRGWDGQARRARTGELLELVGLQREARRFPHQMSGGQQQRVALARALAIEPQVLLLDEPLSALDAKVRDALRDEIRNLQRRLRITTIFVTHDQAEALSIADRVCVMRNGHAEQVGPPEAVYSSPTTAFVAEFVGVMNRLPGRVLDDRVEVLGQVVEFTKTPDAPAIANGQTVDVLVRPESLRVRRASHGWGIVTGRTFLGSTVRLGVMINDGRQIQTELPRQAGGGIDPGTAVDLEISDVPVLVDAPQSSWAGHPPSPARSTPVLVGGADAEAQ